MQSARPVWCGYHSQVGRSAISSIFFNISSTVLAAVFVSCRNFYFIFPALPLPFRKIPGIPPLPRNSSVTPRAGFLLPPRMQILRLSE